MVTQEDKKLAQQLLEYLKMKQSPQPADCILVLGTYDERVALKGIELYQHGYAPYIIFSGGMSAYAKKHWNATEADHFKKLARAAGVPEKNVVVENRSLNTGENILFTKKILQEENRDPQSFLVIQKPYMERRTYATFKKHWPEKTIMVTSPNIPFEELPAPGVPMETVINSLVGDMQRIKIYPEKGYHIPQHIPNAIWSAFEALVARGYDKKLVKNNIPI